VENVLVKEWEDLPLKGPTSLAYNKDDNELIFCDGGVLLESSLFPKNGSVFAIDLDSKIMRPILYKCLSFPSDLLYHSESKCIYVAETFANRILRLKQNEDGVYYSSVFHQFNGRLGPSALTMDEYGNLYVGIYDFTNENIENDGLIAVLNPEGALVGEIILPKLPEVTGIFISLKKKENLYLTVRNSTGIIKIKLSHFLTELEKSKQDDNMKFHSD
jgi:sugar lactone lactonase YvrE